MNRSDEIYDVAVIGGGINGAGIAADAAMRGLSVLLVEQADLASATSSASTKLIHGGLRYLETYEFRLVRKALKESQLILEMAPHLVEPIPINIPYLPHLRPWLLIRAGLFLYNRLAVRPSYPSARSVRMGADGPLVNTITRGFSFSDAQVDDARLVIVNAIQAAEHGATILTRHRCVKLLAEGDTWHVNIDDLVTMKRQICRARVVVNATGPWVSNLVAGAARVSPRQHVRLVKGSHIVVPRISGGELAYMLQNEDDRIVFVIPYEGLFTMIGTTEEEFQGDPAEAAISGGETDYLLSVYNRYFKAPLTRDDIVASWSGIRPLIEDDEASATRASRDYQLEFERTPLPLLSIYGGKVTTYRLLAEQAIDRLETSFPGLAASRTAGTCLPGGDFSDRRTLRDELSGRYPWLPAELTGRWVRAYGTRVERLVDGVDCLAGLGQDFGHGLTRREVDYLVDSEWATTTEDILWRRTRLGLLFSDLQAETLQNYLTSRLADTHSRP